MKALLLTTMTMRSSPSGMVLKPVGKNVFVIRRLTKRWSRRPSRRSRSKARLIVKPLGVLITQCIIGTRTTSKAWQL
jgi:hypothetical protein